MKKRFLLGLAFAVFVAANTASAQQEKAPAKSENSIDKKSSKDVDKSFKQNKKGSHHHHKHHKGAKPAPKQ